MARGDLPRIHQELVGRTASGPEPAEWAEVRAGCGSQTGSNGPNRLDGIVQWRPLQRRKGALGSDKVPLESRVRELGGGLGRICLP